jgi:hypothetical protein
MALKETWCVERCFRETKAQDLSYLLALKAVAGRLQIRSTELRRSRWCRNFLCYRGLGVVESLRDTVIDIWDLRGEFLFARPLHRSCFAGSTIVPQAWGVPSDLIVDIPARVTPVASAALTDRLRLWAGYSRSPFALTREGRKGNFNVGVKLKGGLRSSFVCLCLKAYYKRSSNDY